MSTNKGGGEKTNKGGGGGKKKKEVKKEMKLGMAYKKDDNFGEWYSQVWFQTDKAAYLLREYSYSNLHDRISTRPFLNQIEMWLAFQGPHSRDEALSTTSSEGSGVKAEGGPTEPTSVPKA